MIEQLLLVDPGVWQAQGVLSQVELECHSLAARYHIDAPRHPADDVIRASNDAKNPELPQIFVNIRTIKHGNANRVETEAPAICAPKPYSRLMKELETHVRLCPEQYGWIHKRFKGRPEPYPDIYQTQKQSA